VSISFAHTNIIAEDGEKLSDFYKSVFSYTPLSPERNQSGDWLKKGTEVKGTEFQGVHLLLPGHGDSGPTPEIFSYKEMLSKAKVVAANRKGFGHIAFQVDDVPQTRARGLEAGGPDSGEIISREVKGAGTFTGTYMGDPEGNILELQSWA